MLHALSIKNFALIDHLEIQFSDGFSVITGETGSGKSILLGALGLALGNRADVSSIKDKDKKCAIEVVFDISKYNLKAFFIENDIDYESETTIRREILPNGKSRAFVNDTPVKVTVLNELGAQLIDIHSQNQTQSLADPEFQFQILDVLAGTHENIQNYSEALKEYKKQKKLLQELEILKENATKDQDYNLFLFQELETAQLQEGEQELLEEELETLSHTEIIKESFNKITALSHHDEVGVIVLLNEIKAAIAKIQSFSGVYQDFANRVTSVLIELTDVVRDIESASERLSDDPERLSFVNQKLQNIYTLQQKHKVPTVAALCLIRDELSQKVADTASLDDRIQQAILELNQIQEKTQSLGLVIDSKRKSVIDKLEQKVSELLSRLGMPEARLQVDLQTTEQLYPNGINQISFLFSANKGSDLDLIKKVASGGELSRMMLVVKSILATYTQLPTIIFDEIDTGVSGDIANKMGEIMQEMSQFMQVFSITHLPQVAAKGNQHYKVFKQTNDTDTTSELKKLNSEERITEIAEMLSGKDISETALIHAKSLLN